MHRFSILFHRLGSWRENGPSGPLRRVRPIWLYRADPLLNRLILKKPPPSHREAAANQMLALRMDMSNKLSRRINGNRSRAPCSLSLCSKRGRNTHVRLFWRKINCAHSGQSDWQNRIAPARRSRCDRRAGASSGNSPETCFNVRLRSAGSLRLIRKLLSADGGFDHCAADWRDEDRHTVGVACSRGRAAL